MRNKRRAADITGQTFGRWVVVSRVSSQWWLCRCACGTEGNRRIYELTRKKNASRSCGCLKIEELRARVTTHGESRGGRTAEYIIWKSMKSRCYNAAEEGYQWYGARGISVCDEWRESFESFLRDMGRRPSAKHSLDRKDNDGNYEPGNCRWATAGEQGRNRRNNVMITIDGRTQCATDWAAETGRDVSDICKRVKAGCQGREVITPRPHGPKPKVRT